MARANTIHTESSRESFGELLSDLATTSAALLRDEIALAKQELREKIKVLRAAIITTVTGGMLCFLAAMTLCAAAVIGLAPYLGPGVAALIIGIGLAVMGGIGVLFGLRQLNAKNLKPEKTIQTLKEDKEWLKEMT